MNIVFDWSGTLADDHSTCWKITNQTLDYFKGKKKNYDILPEDFEGEDYTVWFW